PRRAWRRNAARGSPAPLRGRATAHLPDAEAVAPRASEGRRGARLRRLPQLDPRADRRARAPHPLGARRRPGRRPDEARALRRRGSCRAGSGVTTASRAHGSHVTVAVGYIAIERALDGHVADAMRTIS